MDDFYNDLFNNGGENEPKTEEPVASAEPEIPAEPEAVSEPVISEPVIPQEPAAPAQPQYTPPAYQPPTVQNNNNYNVPNGTFYTPPAVEQKQQFTPPVFNQADNGFNPQSGYSYQPQMNEPQFTPPKSPKKHGKGLGVIMVIAIICAVVAIGGLWAANNVDSLKSADNGTKTSQQEESNKEDAQAEVKSSDEAAKTDESGNLTTAGVAEKVKDSCVGITVYTEQDAYSYFYNYGQNENSSGGKTASGEGSGIIMSESGGKTYIMTCAHVISDGSSFTVTLDNDKEYEATMVGYDSQTDIGVLSINATGLSVAEFGDSKDIEVGEDCIAIGCPGGLTFKNSVTRGIVSALDVPVSSSIGYSNECIQVDAAINPGNSGGALFNMQGQVIGINSSKIASTDYEGMGFAVPSNTAVETANSLIKNGYVAGRAKIGIMYNTLSNYNSAQSILSALAQKGFEDAQGTMVIQEVDDESDLKGKVEQYDMIVAIDGKTLTSVDVLTSVLSKSKPGDTIKLTIARVDGNRIKTFEVTCKLIESKN